MSRAVNRDMQIVVGETAADAALAGAEHVAWLVVEAHAARGSASIAFSGGSTPRMMFDALTEMSLPWSEIHVFQVDERVAPDGASIRNRSIPFGAYRSKS
jgi:6-phosphogluconolactonase/glucosamine-6-phosphate isomerase/deaminase